MIRLAIVLLATLVALFLYWRKPMAYVSFTLWVWFLVPLVRRLIDWKIGWAEPNYVLLTPLLVSSVSALAFLVPNRNRPMRILPTFFLCTLAIIYGFAIGLLTHPSAEAVYGLFNWMAPILFGMYLALSSRDYPRLRRCIEHNITAGAAFMGIYGIYQFLTAPAWDTFWLENISEGLIDPSFGQPSPFKIRVWSSLNGPGPFANVMLALLLLLFVSKVRLKLPASMLGYVALMLSVVRTAWLDFGLGFLLLMRGERPSRILKLLAAAGVIAIVLVPVVQSPNLAPLLGSRFRSFYNLHQDESFRERQEMYKVIGAIIEHDPFGHGLLNTEIDHNLVVDSGVLIMLLQLGWVGTALYGIGVLTFLIKPSGNVHVPIDTGSGPPEKPGAIATATHYEEDRMPLATRSVCIAYLAQLVGGLIFVSASGMIFWMCMGMASCAAHWQQLQQEGAATPEPLRRKLRAL
jgi:hypothetical protein